MYESSITIGTPHYEHNEIMTTYYDIEALDISYQDYKKGRLCSSDLKLQGNLSKDKFYQILNVFYNCDLNQDYRVGRKEFYKIIRSLGVNPKESTLDDLFMQLDVNKKGCLTFQELLKLAELIMMDENAEENEMCELMNFVLGMFSENQGGKHEQILGDEGKTSNDENDKLVNLNELFNFLEMHQKSIQDDSKDHTSHAFVWVDPSSSEDSSSHLGIEDFKKELQDECQSNGKISVEKLRAVCGINASSCKKDHKDIDLKEILLKRKSLDEQEKALLDEKQKAENNIFKKGSIANKALDLIKQNSALFRSTPDSLHFPASSNDPVVTDPALRQGLLIPSSLNLWKPARQLGIGIPTIHEAVSNDNMLVYEGRDCDRERNKKTRRPTTSRKNEIAAQLNLLANAMDNFSHGLTVGSAFLISSKSGFLSSFGILLHEIPHEFGDFAILLKSGKTIIECSLCQLSTSITSFIGGMTALFIGSGYQKEALAWLLPLSAGGFIFIALSTMKSLYEVEDENYKGTENYTNSNNAGQNLHQTKHKNEESEDIQSEEGKTSNDNSRKQDGRTTKSMNMKNYELKRRMMKREIKTNVDDEDEKEEKDNEEENIQKNLERIQKRQLEENFLKAINNKIIKICKSMKNTLILASISSDADKKRSNQQTSKTRKGKNTNEKEANIQGKYGVCQTEKDLNTNLYSKSEYLNVNLEYIPGKNRNFIKSEKEKVKISNASRDEKEIFIKNEKESLFSARAATASSEKGNLQILNFIFEACSILTGLIIMYCAMKWC